MNKKLSIGRIVNNHEILNFMTEIQSPGKKVRFYRTKCIYCKTIDTHTQEKIEKGFACVECAKRTRKHTRIIARSMERSTHVQ